LPASSSVAGVCPYGNRNFWLRDRESSYFADNQLKMTNYKTGISPLTYARIGGLIYLIIIVLGGVDEAIIRSKLIVPGDVLATSNNIMASRDLFRKSIVGDLLMQVCDIPSIVIFYILLKPVSKTLSLLAAAFNLIQTAVLAMNKIYLLVTLSFLGNEEYLKAFDPHQRQALAYLSLDLHESGYGIGLIFFGFECLIDGYLIFKSGFLPKILGILLLIAGLCYLLNSFALILFPALSDSIYQVVIAPIFISELSMCLWLLVKGVNITKWKEVTA